MKILILGAGVIGTIYGYVFKQANHEVKHLLRDQYHSSFNNGVDIELLDGRLSKQGSIVKDHYMYDRYQSNTCYDFIVLSVSKGKIKEAVASLKANQVKGSILLFCNFFESEDEIQSYMDDYPFVIGFPVAGGYKSENTLQGVLFNRVMLEAKVNASIPNYDQLVQLFKEASIEIETTYLMSEWIWIHMVINAAVGVVAMQNKDVSPQMMAKTLMDSQYQLRQVIYLIRELLPLLKARGVNLKHYRQEVIFYRMPSFISAKLMKRMFRKNRLTREIMLLHNDAMDIYDGITKVYQACLTYHIKTPMMDRMMIQVNAYMHINKEKR